MASAPPQDALRWSVPPASWLLIGAVAAALLSAFYPALRELVAVWETEEEYSYGYMIPFVAAYLAWQKRGALMALPFRGSWAGTALVSAGLAVMAVARIGTLGTVVQYAFLLVLLGLVLSWTGWRALRVIAMPLAVLAFMVPLPNYFLRELSAALQLLSSQLGVEVIRAFGISVFLEGNVIDLGVMKLQVVEACSGLRYLFSLMTIGFIAAILFRAPLWQRAVVFLSTIPITVLMNSLRIGMIGVLVEHFGKSMAEGFLHDFEGWAVFMVCMAILILEIALLARIGPVKASLGQVFGFEETPLPLGGPALRRGLPAAFVASGALMLATAGAVHLLPEAMHIAPERQSFSQFPLTLNDWRGRAERLEPDVLRLLKLDDYVLADYVAEDAASPVNLYVSYYASQAGGNSAHSPRACIPGDGWEIGGFTQRELPGVMVADRPLRVNRVVIRKGENRQLVYYWFQQRGRTATDEYVVKLQIFWDAVTRQRTDGAMVRLVARLNPGEPDAAGDDRLQRFAGHAVPLLKSYVPD